MRIEIDRTPWDKKEKEIILGDGVPLVYAERFFENGKKMKTGIHVFPPHVASSLFLPGVSLFLDGKDLRGEYCRDGEWGRYLFRMAKDRKEAQKICDGFMDLRISKKEFVSKTKSLINNFSEYLPQKEIRREVRI